MNDNRLMRALVYCFVMLAVPGLLIPAYAQEEEVVEDHLAQAYLARDRDPVKIDRERLERFLDDFFSREMTRLNIPGAVFSMVKGGELFFSKGYGFADAEREIPVDPQRTLFRVASLSKSFTATAAMQLYEQGKLELHEDVNTYLKDFQLAETFEAPVTMAHLLTHTGGFDDRSVNLAYNREELVPSLEEYLAYNMPPRVIPPGEVISYSNHGSGLAGLVIEKISGLSFVDYADRMILEPLGMERSSFLLPAELAPDLATGHFSAGGYNQPREFDYLFNIAPAASLNSTAEDIARFMIAHLQGGRLGRRRILRESTVEKMHNRQFAHYPELAGVTYGFFERFAGNRRFIYHSGLWGGFASLLFLCPEEEIGFFVSANSDAGTGLHQNLSVEFIENFLPAGEEGKALPAPELFLSQAGACFGSYRPVRYSRHGLEKAAVLFEQVRATDLGDGHMALVFSFWSEQQPVRWVEKAPFFFRQANGEDGLAFRRDERGRVTHLFWGTLAMERLAWYENAALHQVAVIAFLLVFISAWVGWPLFLSYRLRGKKFRDDWRERWPAAAAALLNSVFLAGIIYIFTSWPDAFIYGISPVLLVLLALPLLASVLTAASLWMALTGWRKRNWTLTGRRHYSFVLLFLLLFIPFLYYWNLFGFRF